MTCPIHIFVHFDKKFRVGVEMDKT